MVRSGFRGIQRPPRLASGPSQVLGGQLATQLLCHLGRVEEQIVGRIHPGGQLLDAPARLARHRTWAPCSVAASSAGEAARLDESWRSGRHGATLDCRRNGGRRGWRNFGAGKKRCQAALVGQRRDVQLGREVRPQTRDRQRKIRHERSARRRSRASGQSHSKTGDGRQDGQRRICCWAIAR